MESRSRLPLVYYRTAPPEERTLLRFAATPGQRAARKLGDFLGDGLFSAAPDAHAAVDGARLQVFRTGRPAAALGGVGELRAHEAEFEIGRIYVDNPAPRPAVLPSGAVFLGGAQNRMLLWPELIPPGGKRIEVFCVEAGRWQRGAGAFQRIARAPELFWRRIADEVSAADLSHEDIQQLTWNRALEALVLTDQLNSTLDLMQHLQRAAAPEPALTAPDGADGFLGSDAAAGLSSFGLYPATDVLRERLQAQNDESNFRRRLLNSAVAAREYFRVFDAGRRIAIRCDALGRPLRDMRGANLLFEYEDHDLTNGFRPPIEAPAPAALSYANEPAIETLEEWRAVLEECETRAERISGAGNAVRLVFGHPERSINGAALIYEGRLAQLEATAFRPHARLN